MNCDCCHLGGGHKGPEDCVEAVLAELKAAHSKLDEAGVPKDVGAGLGLSATLSSRVEWLLAHGVTKRRIHD